ncbi:MAG TPA: ATP-binding protein [Labilithrix sp.]|nr:ATP-binding protein [Labilithrix sp.]
MNGVHTVCDREPIHLVGGIQPHGVLLALEERTLRVTHVSVNVRALLHLETAAVLGRPLELVLGEAAARAVRHALGAAHPELANPLSIEHNGVLFDGLLHRHRGGVFLELEPRDGSNMAALVDAKIRGTVGRLQAARNAHELGEIAVEEVRSLTSFDRVMMYLFDREEHGAVVHEARSPELASLLGLRYPASDIPWQARALYIVNWLRLIPDACYTPVAIVPDAGPEAVAPLDLSFSVLRSVSPVHVEYLRNMGVRASMSISLVQGNRLVGLLACHHKGARFVPFVVRGACELVGRLVSLQLAAFAQIDATSRQSTLRGMGASLADAMRATKEDATSGLITRGDMLLELVGASGAAISNTSGIHLIGLTPSRDQVAELVSWLHRHGGSVVETCSLSRIYPPAQAFAREASGLLAVSSPTRPPATVMWFRQEVVQTVRWGGDPTAPSTDPSDRRIRPRHSFEIWKEIVTDRSLPWTHAEIEAAEDLRRSAIEADLLRQIDRAERAIEERDELIAIVSHDLKNPLNVIKMATHMIGERERVPMVERIARAARSMEILIGDLLDRAKIEGGRLALSLGSVSTKTLVDEAVVLIAPIAEQKGIRLLAEAVDMRVHADADRILQVLSNLLGNAIKFTPSGGTIRLTAGPEGACVRFEVADTGAGIPPSDLANVFERYWQGRGAARSGSGLGLYIAKGIIEAHGGRIWAESQIGRGTSFWFTLPTVDRGER